MSETTTSTNAGSYGEHKADLSSRLNRIEGQIRGIARMVGDDEYCVDILTQVAAVRAALDRVALIVLDDHIKGCVADAVGTDDKDAKIEELVEVLERFVALRK